MRRRQPLARIFAVPGLLALATLAGLVLALLGDGAWDVAADALLATPFAALVQCWRRTRPAQAAIVSSVGSQSVATSR